MLTLPFYIDCENSAMSLDTVRLQTSQVAQSNHIVVARKKPSARYSSGSLIVFPQLHKTARVDKTIACSVTSLIHAKPFRVVDEQTTSQTN